MKMKRCLIASILLMLSLEAALLVAGRPSDAAVVGTILLPSNTEVTKASRPWKCCNVAPCTKSIPPICNCADEVEQCAPTCKDCTASTSNLSLFVCNDQYIGDPGPICRRSECLDEVDQCAATCKSCEVSTWDPSLYVCKDTSGGAIEYLRFRWPKEPTTIQRQSPLQHKASAQKEYP